MLNIIMAVALLAAGAGASNVIYVDADVSITSEGGVDAVRVVAPPFPTDIAGCHSQVELRARVREWTPRSADDISQGRAEARRERERR
jgi:hypothetical protein